MDEKVLGKVGEERSLLEEIRKRWLDQVAMGESTLENGIDPDAAKAIKLETYIAEQIDA
jgi:hypothetical protein